MDRCGRRDRKCSLANVPTLIHPGLGDDDVHFYIVWLRVDRLQTSCLEGDADDERKGYQRSKRPIVKTTAIAESKPLLVKAQARNQQTFGLNCSALRRHGDAGVTRAHRGIRRPGMERKHLVIDRRQCCHAPRIRCYPRSDDRAQIGFTANWKVKPECMHACVMQPVGYTALQLCFKFAPVDKRCARFDQTCAQQLLVGSTIQLSPLCQE
jgi:hypothetical protein